VANVKQDKVVRCFDKIFLKRMRPPLLHKKSRGDNRGPDRVLERNGKRYYLEAIGWTEKPRGKNQSDFWKAFSQAIARLNKKSQWGNLTSPLFFSRSNSAMGGKIALVNSAKRYGCE